MFFAFTVLVVVIYAFLLLVVGIYYVAKSEMANFKTGVKRPILNRFFEMAFVNDVKGNLLHKKLILLSIVIAISMLMTKFINA